MTETSKVERRHARLVGALRLLAALAWLALAGLVFKAPIRQYLAPAGIFELALPSASPRGFMAEVVSEPPGALLLIDGAQRGMTPVRVNVACREGQKLTFEVAKEGYRPWRRTLACPQGGSYKVSAQLHR